MASSSSSGIDIPMVDDSKFLHGRVDPGLEESLALVEAVPVKAPERGASQSRNDPLSSQSRDCEKVEDTTILQPQSISSPGTSMFYIQAYSLNLRCIQHVAGTSLALSTYQIISSIQTVYSRMSWLTIYYISRYGCHRDNG